jgi:hypothetical protein
MTCRPAGQSTRAKAPEGVKVEMGDGKAVTGAVGGGHKSAQVGLGAKVGIEGRHVLLPVAVVAIPAVRNGWVGGKDSVCAGWRRAVRGVVRNGADPQRCGSQSASVVEVANAIAPRAAAVGLQIATGRGAVRAGREAVR